MVHSQYRLLTKKLGIKHIYGIIGGSMGGMQVFEWIVTYPDFMDKAVPYVGSPRLTSYDLLLWYTELMVIEEGQVYEMPDRSIEQMVAAIHAGADYVVTRNIADFKMGPLPAIMPAELLALLG